MTTVILLVLLFAGALAAQSQTFSEWWQQKKTRMKYLREQVAALAALGQSIRVGYNVAAKGIDAIGYIRNSEYREHLSFFQSLEIMSPGLHNDPSLEHWLSIESHLTDFLDQKLTFYATNPFLGDLERASLVWYVQKLTELIHGKKGELVAFTIDEQWTMNDAERLTCLLVMGNTMIKLYDLIGERFMQTDALIANRQQERANSEYLQTLLK